MSVTQTLTPAFALSRDVDARLSLLEASTLMKLAQAVCWEIDYARIQFLWSGRVVGRLS